MSFSLQIEDQGLVEFDLSSWTHLILIGLCYALGLCWASLMDELVKNPPAMQETWVQSLSWEDLLEKGKATHSSILA